MSKKQWLLAILVCIGMGYLIVSKINPEMGWSIDNVLGGTIGSLKTGIESTPVWQQYDVWFSGAFFATVAALIVWKGRNIADNIRGIARVRATEGTKGYQITPTATPTIIPQPAPTPAVTPTPQPVAPPKQEKEQTA